MKKIIIFLAAAALLLTLASCEVKPPEPSNLGGNNPPDVSSPSKITDIVKGDTSDMAIQLQPPKDGDTIVSIETNMGTMKAIVYPEFAPKAVENFITHASEGYYDGVIFHRIIENFMIQGGDPDGTGYGGESIWGEDFDIEVCSELHHLKGALCMARRGDTTVSQSSQFYIVHGDKLDKAMTDQMRGYTAEDGWGAEIADAYDALGGYPGLDFQYTVFGQVYEGLDVIDKIASVETNSADQPKEQVIINTIKVETYSAQ